MYLYFYAKHKDTGEIKEEIVKVRDILFFWDQTPEGINEINSANNHNSVTVRVWRGQLGTKAVDFSGTTSNFFYPDRMKIRVVTPKLKYPKGAKGRDTKIVFQNQKASIDSFAITYRPKKFK